MSDYTQMAHELLDEFRHQILEICKTPKTCAQVVKLINSTRPKVYAHLEVLAELKNLTKIITPHGTRHRLQFQTINADYYRGEYLSQRVRSVPAAGRFIHKIENYEAQHRATAKMNRENFKSGRVNIGISTVYD